VTLDASIVRLSHRCPCEKSGGACDNKPEGAVFGRMWSMCPWHHARNPHFLAVAYLTRCLDAGAVAGWPGDFAGGVVDGVHALRHERDQWQVRQMKGAQ